MMRKVLLLAFTALAGFVLADQIDEDIAALNGVRGDDEAFGRLIKGDAEVDRKALEALRTIKDRSPSKDRLRRVLQVLEHRWSLENVRNDVIQSQEAVSTVLAVSAREKLTPDNFFYSRGPAFYPQLLHIASASEEGKPIALRLLRTTALSQRRLGRIDPNLVKVFRAEQDLPTLGILNDRASYEAMRRAIQGQDPMRRNQAFSAVMWTHDPLAAPLILPFVAGAEDAKERQAEGKFGSAGWALKRTATADHIKLLKPFAKEHTGYPRAVAINVLGYVGGKDDIKFLESFAQDTNPRVAKAAENAVRRIKGELPKRAPNEWYWD